MNIEDRDKSVRMLQRVLKTDGLYTGKIDGIHGKLTAAALNAWRERYAKLCREYPLDARSEATLAPCCVSLQKVVRPWMQKVYEWAKASGKYEVKIIQGLRSDAEQSGLSAAVTSAAGGRSYHNYGAAIDIGIFDTTLPKARQYDGVPDAVYKALQAAVGTPDGCIWGGVWKKVDYPHYQLGTWGSTISPLLAYLNK